MKKAYHTKTMLTVYSKATGEPDGKHLLGIAHRILTENSIPSRLDTKELGQLLLYMLQSRGERNIKQAELDDIENSGSLGFQGFFGENTLSKTLFK